MHFKNSVRWQRYTLGQAWIGTVLIVVAALLARLALDPILKPYAVFHLFIVACFLVQFLFGFRFALVAMLLSMVLGEYYLVAPHGLFDQVSVQDIILDINFLLVTGAGTAIMERLQRATYAQKLMIKVMESRHKISLVRDNDRLFYARRSNETWAILEELIVDADRNLFYRYGGDDYKISPLFYRLATRLALTQAAAEWDSAVHPEDVAAIRERLGNDRELGPFDIRLLQADGQAVPARVVIDHFRFMGKHLSVLKLAEPLAVAMPAAA